AARPADTRASGLARHAALAVVPAALRRTLHERKDSPHERSRWWGCTESPYRLLVSKTKLDCLAHVEVTLRFLCRVLGNVLRQHFICVTGMELGHKQVVLLRASRLQHRYREVVTLVVHVIGSV